jgi:GTP-binding protein EngB required for normal cell division
MINKDGYIDTLAQANEILKKYSFEKLISQAASINMELIDFKVKVLFVGGFSAGKTALINSLVYRDLLEENLRPETAIATELVYGEDEQIILTSKNYRNSSCGLSEIANHSVEDYLKYRYLVDSPVLKELEDYIIVDMPGFDSGVEQHNKALMQYIDQGVAFLFVIDCEKGSISQSALAFLGEIKKYSENISFLLNKSDKRIPADVESIKNKVIEDIKRVLGYSPMITTTSKYDERISDLVLSIIKSFDPQVLMERKFNDRLIFFLDNATSALTTIKNSLEFDPHELDIAISKREKTKVFLIDSMRAEKSKLHNRMQTAVKSSILADIQQALHSNASMLASSAQAGGQAFSQSVNNLIRPVLLSSIEKNIELSFNEFVSNLKFEQMNGIDADELSKKASILMTELQNISSKAGNYNGLYKSILTALAITTTVVAPWLELLIIFLPDILKLLSSLSKSNHLESLQRKIVSEVIPNILTKLEPEIEKSLLEVEERMLIHIETQFNELIDMEIAALDELKNQKAEKMFNLQNYREEIDQDLLKINEITATL